MLKKFVSSKVPAKSEEDKPAKQDESGKDSEEPKKAEENAEENIAGPAKTDAQVNDCHSVL